jgi:hypothetical protein
MGRNTRLGRQDALTSMVPLMMPCLTRSSSERTLCGTKGSAAWNGARPTPSFARSYVKVPEVKVPETRSEIVENTALSTRFMALLSSMSEPATVPFPKTEA